MGREATSGTQLQGLIRGIQAGFSSFYALVLTPQDVSLAQFAVLLCLAQQRPRKMSEVAKALHVSLPAVTHLVDRLVAKRMVRRLPHPTDRRVNLVDVTDRGLQLLAQTQGRTIRVLTNAYMRQSKIQQQGILDFLDGVRTGIRKAAQDVESHA